MSTLERQALALFRRWGVYDQGYYVCGSCGLPAFCRKASARGKWLCFECFDLGGG